MNPEPDSEGFLLERLAAEEHWRVRVALVHTFDAASFSSPETVAAMIGAFADPNTAVRISAASVISNMKPPPPAALPKMVDLVENVPPAAKANVVGAIARYDASRKLPVDCAVHGDASRKAQCAAHNSSVPGPNAKWMGSGTNRQKSTPTGHSRRDCSNARETISVSLEI